MHLAFVDFVYGYDANRPDLDEPLGGTTSAICFLAREMVEAGVSCTFFNRVTGPQSAHGIKSLPLQTLADEIGRDIYDAYIFCGRWTEELVGLVRKHTQAPLIAWMHESVFAPPMTPALEAFDGVVFVSEWQQRINQNALKPKGKQAVIRNAMNPSVMPAFAANESILGTKTKPPILLFAGTFVRGAFHIPPLLDKIREVRTDFSVEMFCNLDPSRDPTSDAAYVKWLKSQANITHVGMVGQKELIDRMRRAAIMLMPNPWPETSCIAMIEGLATGLDVVATARAALPETASGFARLVSIPEPDEPVRFDMSIDYNAFAAVVLEAMREREEKQEALEARLHQQVEYFHAHYQWAQRTAPWVKFIKSLR
jgi:glycosyltransferase involved in cell wall biosynthesis